MKNVRHIALFLCFALLVTCAAPCSSAASPENVSLDNVISADNKVIYYFENTAKRFCIVLNTSTGNGSCAILYTAQEDYVYDYHFSITPDEIQTNSITFWEELATDCLSSTLEQPPLYLPDTITVSNNINEISTYASSDDFEKYYLNWLESHFDSAPYSLQLVSTGYRGPYTFFIRETLTYAVGEVNRYLITQALSAAGLIVSVLSLVIAPGLLSALGVIASAGGVFTPGTELTEYTLCASWIRNVRKSDSSRNLTVAEKHVFFTGYSSSETGKSSVVESSEDIRYAPSQAYFEDTAAQFDDGYEYWMLNYA